MAIKSSITSTINGFITVIVTVAKTRSAFSTLLDNVYPTPITDTHLTTNVVTSINSNFTYDLTFTKIGRMVHVNGRITSISGSSMFVEDIASITTSEFLPYSGYSFSFTTSISNSKCNFNINSDGITLASSLGAGESVYFNVSYPTLN